MYGTSLPLNIKFSFKTMRLSNDENIYYKERKTIDKALRKFPKDKMKKKNSS